MNEKPLAVGEFKNVSLFELPLSASKLEKSKLELIDPDPYPVRFQVFAMLGRVKVSTAGLPINFSRPRIPPVEDAELVSRFTPMAVGLPL